jgi:thioredoxin reductase (NADPH)
MQPLPVFELPGGPVVEERRDIHDAVVVGAGPAGLTAAIYLGRFRRRCVVLENGQSRARWIPTSHNIPGFTAGIGGEEFLKTLRQQALKYGAQLRHTQVSKLTVEDGIFALHADGETLYSRHVLLATGVKDHLPAIDGAAEAVMRSLLRFCPICDAFEAIDKRIAVICDGALGEREAEFLKNYSSQVTLLHLGSPTSTAAATCAGDIECIAIQLSDLRIDEDRVTLCSITGDRRFDVIYIALGCTAQHALAQSLRACCDEHGALRVNAHQETSVPGLYAAGDVVRGLNQVVVAAAESAIAATDIHNKLRGKACR